MSLEQLDQLAEKVSQAMFLIQKLRAEKAVLENKTAEQADKIEVLELDVMTRDEEISELKASLADRESQIESQTNKIDDASERLQRMLSALSGMDAAPTAESATEENAEATEENPQQALF